MDFLELRDTVRELNEATEKINRELSDIEEFLKTISPGLTVWINDEDDKKKFFGYTRFGKEWHLAIRLEREEESEDKIQPILGAARYYRLALYNRRNKIIQALIEASKIMIDKIDKSLSGEAND